MNVQNTTVWLTTPNHYNIEREQIHWGRKQTDKKQTTQKSTSK